MRKKFTADYKVPAVLEVLRETETLTQIASKRGIHPAQLQKWRREALAGLPSVFERSPDKEKQALEAQVQELYAQLGEATSRLAWLNKNLASTFDRPARLGMIEREGSEFSIREQCKMCAP